MRKTEEILLDAIAVTRERGKHYGPPLEHFARTVGAINAIFAHKLKEPLEPEDWAAFMVLDKLARDQETPKRDNDLDGIGYLACRHECRSGTLSLSLANVSGTIEAEVPKT